MEEKQRKISKVKIVIDTNIIFSLLLNTNSNIGKIFLGNDNNFKFYSCSYMRFEIEKHWSKLLNISKLKESELQESKYTIYKKINFIDEALIPNEIWNISELLVTDIDEDDIDFLALTMYIKGYLWTGDLKLYNGLKSKKYKRVYTTSDLLNVLQK